MNPKIKPFIDVSGHIYETTKIKHRIFEKFFKGAYWIIYLSKILNLYEKPKLFKTKSV